uniref:Aminopeptidase n=1 Tax=Periophthalmus magnuspinnatus TaxID=409849 RepID=A0A3B3Z6Y8_9GOBI
CISLSVVYSQEKSKNEVLPTVDPSVTTTTVSTTPSGPKEPWQQYRLPDSLVPITYHVTLWPRLKPVVDNFYIFSGNSTVEFKCVKATDLILIHSNKLNLTTFDNFHAKLVGLNGAEAPKIKQTWLEVPTQYLVIQLQGNLQPDNTYELFTEFVGELADDLGGFYRSEYYEDGVKKVLATTQMQPTDARKAFPCFDEPAMKAVFYMTLLHPHGTVALSNSINYVNVTVDGHDLTRTSFMATEVMSSYLLAFVVCEFAYIRNVDTGVLVTIFTKNITTYIFLDTKMFYVSSLVADQIALPDFGAGAMENWGLITYRETALLYNSNVSSNGDKEWVATVIAHELAHMWFGNLVTTKWWNDLWLNEGFATYVSYLGADFHCMIPCTMYKTVITSPNKVMPPGIFQIHHRIKILHGCIKVDYAITVICTATNNEIQTAPNEWLVANINMKGFYRVNYDSPTKTSIYLKFHQEIIVLVLFQDIPVINRALLIDDAFNLASANLRSTVYCSAIQAGGVDEWDFAWRMYKNASVASEADKLMFALSCTEQYLDYSLDPDMIRKQDATYTIVYIAGNPIGQPLAWDFIRAKWSAISFGRLISGVTKRFSSEFEYKQLLQFKEENAGQLGSATAAVEQALETTKANMNWVALNKDKVHNWFISQTSAL